MFYKKTFNQNQFYLMLLMDIAGTKICEKKLKVTSMVKKYKNKEKPFWKIFSDNTPQLINDGGWHFSLKRPNFN